MSYQPKISIITIVYNGIDLLEPTIKSVLQQSYSNIEYIIVDGQSSDGTLEIIKKYASKISKWISEKDKGLYDAMNKGLNLATGDFVWFMNCGDQIYASDTVEKMVATCEADTDVLFGEVMLVDDARNQKGTRSELTPHVLPEQLKWQSMAYGMVVCHQAFLPRRTLCPKYSLDNLTADIDWVIEILKKSKKNTPTHLILAEYLMGGVSKKRHQQSLNDRYQVLKKHFGWFPNLYHHGIIILRAFWFKWKRRGKQHY